MTEKHEPMIAKYIRDFHLDGGFKPCPFCGSEMIGGTGHVIKGMTGEVRKYFCANCGASSGWRESTEAAIVAWNRRAEE